MQATQAMIDQLDSMSFVIIILYLVGFALTIYGVRGLHNLTEESDKEMDQVLASKCRDRLSQLYLLCGFFGVFMITGGITLLVLLAK